MIRDHIAADRPPKQKALLSTKRIVICIAIMILATSAVFFYPAVQRWSRSELSVDISQIRLGTAVKGDLVREIPVQGKAVAAFHPTVFSPSSGIVTVSTRAGDVVEKGQQIGVVDSPELESQLSQGQSELFSLSAELERRRIQSEQVPLLLKQNIDLLDVQLNAAKRAQQRAEKSRTLGILTAVEYEKSIDDVEILTSKLSFAKKKAQLEKRALAFEVKERRAQLEQQRLVVKELERQVEALRILSPVDGLVSRLHVEDRQAVAEHTSLFTVVDLSAFEVEVAVDEQYASEIGLGTPTVIDVHGKAYPGQIRTIAPEVQGNRVKALVAFAGECPKGLKQNQRVTARLIMEKKEGVLKMKRGPFLKSEGGRCAYVVENGLAVRREIEVGLISLTEVEILLGLEAGEKIIISDTSRFDGKKTVLLRK